MVLDSVAMKLDMEWRMKVENGLTWRLAKPEDMPHLLELWHSMEKKLGRQDKPDLFAMPVVLTLVAEDEQGVIVSGVYGEAVIDFTGIGTDRRSMACLGELFPVLEAHLLERTIRTVRVLVPRRLAKGMKAVLPGLSEITQQFAQFVYQIRL
jgi:hypothetical protein